MRQQIAIVAFAAAAAMMVALAHGQVDPGYIGCRSNDDCQLAGDTGAYCRANGYCHCDAPLFNNTWGGLCQLIQCRADKDCQGGGDAKGSCNDGQCECHAPYMRAPTPAFCNIVDCRTQGGDKFCKADGDNTAYCKPSNGACHCGAGFANFPTQAFCRAPPFSD